MILKKINQNGAIQTSTVKANEKGNQVVLEAEKKQSIGRAGKHA